MDYGVLLLSRIQEEYRRWPDSARAVSAGLEHTGGLIRHHQAQRTPASGRADRARPAVSGMLGAHTAAVKR